MNNKTVKWATVIMVVLLVLISCVDSALLRPRFPEDQWECPDVISAKEYSDWVNRRDTIPDENFCDWLKKRYVPETEGDEGHG